MPKILAIDDKQDNLITIPALEKGHITDCIYTRKVMVSSRV